MIKKIVIRLLILLFIITGLNYIYTYTTFAIDKSEKSPELLEIENSKSNTDVYYFGESSNITYKETDSIKKSISEITSLFYPKLKFVNINKYATHGGIYKYWMKKLQNKKPKAIIVTLNLRSFDASWINSTLETPLRESLIFYEAYPNIINRFLMALGAFDNQTDKQRDEATLNYWQNTTLQFPFNFKHKTVSEWDKAMSEGSYKKPDGSWNLPKIELACHYIKAYAFNLNENNPRIKDFDEMADWCKTNNVNLYLNLMAENVEYADSLVGKELVFLMRQNRDYLMSRYNKNNTIMIDNLEKVSGNQFIDQNWTTEHYAYKGRMIIAKNLAHALKNQFNTEYINAY